MWSDFAAAIGRPELADDEKFNTPEARWENREEITDIIEAWTLRHTKFEAMETLAAAGIPCGACQDTAEVLADPHLEARQMIVDLDYPAYGTFQTVGCPIKLSDSPAEITRPPELGEHTEAILGDLCGVSAQEVARLKGDGVV